MAEQQIDAPEGIQKKPTLWSVRQAPQIFREVMHDVLAAVKSCSAVEHGVQALQEASAKRKQLAMKSANGAAEALARHRGVQMRMQKHLPQLVALNILKKHLSDRRDTESEWGALAMELEK